MVQGGASEECRRRMRFALAVKLISFAAPSAITATMTTLLWLQHGGRGRCAIAAALVHHKKPCTTNNQTRARININTG